MNTTPVAFFDFDGTLTIGDSLMPFLAFVVGKPTYYFKLALISPVLATYFLKLLRNDIAKEIVLKFYLKGRSLDDLRSRGQRFSDLVIPGMLRPEGIDRLRWHQSQGHDCVLVSASLDIYLSPWVSSQNISGLISSSMLVGGDGRVPGKLHGRNCFGVEKASRIAEFLQNRSPSSTYAYGDSPGDVSMLNQVDHGFMWSGRTNSFEDFNVISVRKEILDS